MTEVKIKFYNSESLYFQSEDREEQVLKEDYQTLLVQSDSIKLKILENENQILCFFQLDKCSYELSQKESEQILKLYQQIEEDQEKVICLEIISKTKTIIQKIIKDIDSRKRFIKYKGPLSFQPAKMPRTSLLSTESPVQDYRGFFNVLMIVLFVSHIKQIYDTIKKRGLFLNYFSVGEVIKSTDTFNFVIIFTSYSFYIVTAYIIQVLLFKKIISSRWSVIFGTINIFATILFPLIQLSYFNVGFMSGMILLMYSVIVFMKLISYCHVLRNIDYLIRRIKKLQKDKKDINQFIDSKESDYKNLKILEKYSDNPSKILKFSELMYFMVAPTLCFQLTYPRTGRVRIIWLAKRIAELFVTLILIGYLWLQHVNPVLEEAYQEIKHSEQYSFYLIMHVMISISVSNLYMWLLFFIAFFHLQLNIISELIRYGDRQFYMAWWNCKDLEQYWRLWNLPVHNWLIRHLYNPLLKRGFKKVTSNFIVFFVSAFFHEWIVSGGLREVNYHAFLGMMVQAPIIAVQKIINKRLKLEQSQLGNLTFWISFCFIGQPLAIFIYYCAYMERQIHLGN